MAQEATAGSFVINAMLPPEMRDPNRVWSKKETAKVLTRLARTHPELYREISKKLVRFGYESAYLTGGQSFSLKDISEAKNVKAIRNDIRKETQRVFDKWHKQGVKSDDPRVQREIIAATMKHHKALSEGAMNERKGEDSPFYHQATGTGAQKGFSFNSIIGADLLYVDQDNKPIPFPVVHGYSKGLTPAEYFAGAFGTRKGAVDLQKATADAGFFAKQLVQLAHREVVTSDDAPEPYDESNPIGYPTRIDDVNNEGSYLAHPTAGYKRNTLLTPEVLSDIRRRGISKILVRSVAVGGPPNGGIYGYDAGIREFGRRPATGEFVGISAVQALSEPITQSAISSKHSGGVISADSGKSISGFEYLNQMVQMPKAFKFGAVHSTVDGKVSKIEPAPQGGKYVYINGERHYVGRQQGEEVAITVKPGDAVEAGDVITDGIPNPSQIIKYKGIGEGRRAFIDQFSAALKNSGGSTHRRNLEALSRGLISYVRLTDEIGDYAQDDVLPYAMVAADWKPRKDAVMKRPQDLEGFYLERPVLHYTIGTKIRPSVIRELTEFGVKNILAHKDPPPFEPETIRGIAHVGHDPDWGTRLLGGYQQNSLLEAARRGGTSYTEGTSYVPALAFGGPDFGLRGAIAPPSVRKY